MYQICEEPGCTNAALGGGVCYWHRRLNRDEVPVCSRCGEEGICPDCQERGE